MTLSRQWFTVIYLFYLISAYSHDFIKTMNWLYAAYVKILLKFIFEWCCLCFLTFNGHSVSIYLKNSNKHFESLHWWLFILLFLSAHTNATTYDENFFRSIPGWSKQCRLRSCTFDLGIDVINGSFFSMNLLIRKKN